MLSLILTIHNQENIIERVISSIYTYSSDNINEIIFILDGCTDNSKKIVTKLKRDFKVYELDNVFETKANNFGLKLVENPYAVIVQDDMVIQEKDWDIRLLKPFNYFTDIFAVTGRTAHNIRCIDNNTVVYYGTADRIHGTERNKFYIRHVVNRGPLMLKMDVVKKLNYLDEAFCPLHQDDHDLCLRAYNEGWKSGSYWIDYLSELSWGGTRKGNTSWSEEADRKNAKIIVSRYSELLKTTWDEERDL